MHSLFLADTQDFGVVRLLVDHPKQAAETLRNAGYRATITPVTAVRVPNRPGGLAELLEFMDSENVNVEYGYCFSVGEDYAIDVLKTDEDAQLEEKLVKAGFNPVSPEEIYAVD